MSIIIKFVYIEMQIVLITRFQIQNLMPSKKAIGQNIF